MCHDLLHDPTFFDSYPGFTRSSPPRPAQDAAPVAMGHYTCRITRVNPEVARRRCARSIPGA